MVKCSNCGKELEDNIKFCPECANRVESTDDVESIKKKKFKSLFVIIPIIIAEIGCTLFFAFSQSIEPVNEKEMKADFIEKTAFDKKTYTMDSFEVQKRQTNIDDKTDIIFVKVRSHDPYIAYTNFYVLNYNYYDEGGWLLDEAIDNENEFSEMKPLVGVDDNTVMFDINTYYGVLPDWKYDSVNIIKHNTDLESNTDLVTVELKLKNDWVNVNGSKDFEYSFDTGLGSWVSSGSSTENSDYVEAWDLTGKFEPQVSWNDEIFITESSKDESFKGFRVIPRGNNAKIDLTGTFDRKTRKVYINGNYAFEITGAYKNTINCLNDDLKYRGLKT